jgi:uncharacterized repeat protein (TIGR02059 family)
LSGNNNVPIDSTFKLVFDRGLVRDYWSNNQQCIKMQTISGTNIPINVTRIVDSSNIPIDAEKHNIFVKPRSNLVQGTSYIIIISKDITANNGNILNREIKITFTTISQTSGGNGTINQAVQANKDIADAKDLLPSTFTAVEGNDTNIITSLNKINGIAAKGVTLSINSSNNSQISIGGLITYPSPAELAITGDVTISISKTNGATINKVITIIVPKSTVVILAASFSGITWSVGNGDGTTCTTALPEGDDTFKYLIGNSSIVTQPNVGDTPEAYTNNLTINSDIPITDGQHIYVVRVNSNNKITGWVDFIINQQNIKQPVVLNKIEITNQANKLTYLLNDNLDITGLQVTGTYSDGSSRVLDVTVDNISGFDSTSVSTSETLTISINGCTATYNVSIIAAAPTFASAQVTTDGSVSVSFNKAIADPSGKESGFIVSVNGSPVTITGVSATSTATKIKISLSNSITAGKIVTVAYTKSLEVGKQIVSTDFGVLESFSAQSVTNGLASNFVPIISGITWSAGSSNGTTCATSIPTGNYKYVIGAAGSETQANVGDLPADYTNILTKNNDITVNAGQHIFIVKVNSSNQITGWLDVTVNSSNIKSN